jgi:hypothetical protein
VPEVQRRWGTATSGGAAVVRTTSAVACTFLPAHRKRRRAKVRAPGMGCDALICATSLYGGSRSRTRYNGRLYNLFSVVERPGPIVCASAVPPRGRFFAVARVLVAQKQGAENADTSAPVPRPAKEGGHWPVDLYKQRRPLWLILLALYRRHQPHRERGGRPRPRGRRVSRGPKRVDVR